MISSSPPGSACLSTLPHTKYGSGFSPVTSTFTPFGRYADISSCEISNSHPSLRLHVGSTSTLYINKGTLLGKDITYLSQVWNVWDPESTQAFYEQVLPYIHPKTLRPLMGICAPTVIGLYSVPGGRISLAMELPHPTGWREADPQISAELKEKVIVAYQHIHGQNILHNDVKLENVLIGDDDKVTIVDFCKVVINPEPADLALEMRAVKFMLDYDGAKEVEYERLRRAESRVEKNLRRSTLGRKAKGKKFADRVEPDELPSQDEIDFPPFSRRCLMKWDSEVVSEGTTHCIGWSGKRIEVPENMQSPLWPGIEDYAPPTPSPYQPTDFAALVKKASEQEPFSSHGKWMKRCHYFSSLWSPLPESTRSRRKLSDGAPSSPRTSSGSSYHGGCSEHNFATDIGPSKKKRSLAPPLARKRSRIEDFARPDDRSRGKKRVRRPKSLESPAEYEADPSSWTTRQIRELDRPSSLSRSKGKDRELPLLSAFPRESSPSEAGPPDFSPNPRKSARGATRRSTVNSSRRRGSDSTDSCGSSPVRSSPSVRRALVNASPRDHHLRRKSERACSVIVKDCDGEDKVWLMSREALRDVKGYLQVKKATGAVIEVRSGGEEDSIRHSHQRDERILQSPSTPPTRKRTSSPEDVDEETQRPKRRRSWPDIDHPSPV